MVLSDYLVRPESAGMLVVDGFTELPNKINTRNASRSLVTDPNSGYIYGFGHAYNNNLNLFQVDEQGIELLTVYEKFFYQEKSEIAISGSYLFNQNGQIADISLGEPKLLPRTNTIGYHRQFDSQVVKVDPNTGFFYIIEFDSFLFADSLDNGFNLKVLDPITYELINRVPLNQHGL